MGVRVGPKPRVWNRSWMPLTRSLCVISLGYHWRDHVSSESILDGINIWQANRLVTQRQLRHCGHLAHLLNGDYIHRVIFEKDDPEQRKPKGVSHRTIVLSNKSHLPGDDRDGLETGLSLFLSHSCSPWLLLTFFSLPLALSFALCFIKAWWV